VSSGALGLEAAVIVTSFGAATGPEAAVDQGISALRELAPSAPLIVADTDGTPLR
jgi:hypothetical protein